MPEISALPILLLPLAVPAVIAYFVQIRPKQRTAREIAAIQAGLCVGDRVVTRSGLHATVNALSPQTVDLETCPGSVHRYDRTTVVRLQG